MADQENGKGAQPSENDAAKTQAPETGGAEQQGVEDEDKAEAMEDAQQDAAKEREENRGYQ